MAREKTLKARRRARQTKKEDDASAEIGWLKDKQRSDAHGLATLKGLIRQKDHELEAYRKGETVEKQDWLHDDAPQSFCMNVEETNVEQW